MPAYYEVVLTDVERRTLGKYNSSIVKDHQNTTRLSTEVSTEGLKKLFKM